MSSLLEQLRSAVKQRVSMLSEELPDDIPTGRFSTLVSSDTSAAFWMSLSKGESVCRSGNGELATSSGG